MTLPSSDASLGWTLPHMDNIYSSFCKDEQKFHMQWFSRSKKPLGSFLQVGGLAGWVLPPGNLRYDSHAETIYL